MSSLDPQSTRVLLIALNRSRRRECSYPRLTWLKKSRLTAFLHVSGRLFQRYVCCPSMVHADVMCIYLPLLVNYYAVSWSFLSAFITGTYSVLCGVTSYRHSEMWYNPLQCLLLDSQEFILQQALLLRVATGFQVHTMYCFSCSYCWLYSLNSMRHCNLFRNDCHPHGWLILPFRTRGHELSTRQ